MKTMFTADKLEKMTRLELYNLAQELKIKGRSKLSKEELIVVLKPLAGKSVEPVEIPRPSKAESAPAKRGRPPKAAKSETAKPEKPVKAENSAKPVKTSTVKSVEKVSSQPSLPLPASAVDKFNKECEDEIAALKHLNRAFAKKTDSVAPARSKKGVEVIEHASATPVEFLTGTEELKISKKAEQIENDRRKKHASLKTTMEIPIFSVPSYEHSIPVSEEELTGDLPEDYGETRIVLQIRDPHWAYAYWELPPVERKRLELEVGIFEFAHSHFVLKLHNVSLGHSEEIKLSENARNWYLYLENAQTVYQVELGMQSPVEGYTFITLSNLVQTPPDQVSSRWAEPVSPEAPEALIPAEDHQAARRELSVADYAPRPETAHLTDPAKVYFTSLAGERLPHPGSSDLLAGQRLTLPVMPSSHQSLHHEETSSFNLQMPGSHVAAAFMPASPTSSADSWPSSNSISSFSGRPDKCEEIFLNVAADMIVYGSVAPGCSLSFLGQPLKVRPDGSYSLRLALPLNAEQQIELTAVDPLTQKQRTIKARINFNHQ